MPTRTVFVTGASGQLGSRIVKRLLEQGDTVIGLGRSPASVDKIKSLGATAVHGVLSDVELIKKEASKADAVFHTAFNHDDMTQGYVEKCNEDRACIQACVDGLNSNERGGKVFVYISGTLGLDGPTEDAKPRPNPQMPRGQSEELTLSLASPTLRTCIVRLPPVVHEEGRIHPFVYGMITAARKNGFSAYIDEANVWPSAHYDDVADLCLLSLADKVPSGVALHAVDEEAVSTKAIAEWVGEITSTPTKQIPAEKAMETFANFSGFVLSIPNATATSTKTREVTGWKPQGPKMLEEYRRRGLKEAE